MSDSAAQADQARQIVETAWPIISPYLISGVTFLVGWVLKQPWHLFGKKR